jgi:hypothetical protein
MLVLMENAAEAVAAAYVQAGDLLWIGDRRGQRVQRTGVSTRFFEPVLLGFAALAIRNRVKR